MMRDEEEELLIVARHYATEVHTVHVIVLKCGRAPARHRVTIRSIPLTVWTVYIAESHRASYYSYPAWLGKFDSCKELVSFCRSPQTSGPRSQVPWWL